MCVNVRACALHAILSGDSGEMKLLQGKFWGKRLLNPNIQVGTYMFAPPPFCICKCGWLCVCVCAYM